MASRCVRTAHHRAVQGRLTAADHRHGDPDGPAGLLIRITDPKNIHSLGEGLWWAVQTVTTIGYGVVVPTSPLGRIVGVAVMITGIAFLTVTTAAITDLLIEQARRRRSVTGEAGEEIAALSERIDALVAEVRALRESHDDRGR